MRMTKPAQKKAFWGWAWWTPSVVFAVGVVAFHAWTTIQIRANDYAMAKLRKEKEVLEAELRDVNVQKAEREQMQAVNTDANELGLQPPRPEQIVRLAFNPAAYDPTLTHVDAKIEPETPALPTAKKRAPVKAIEIARETPRPAVAPRETGRMTMARDLETPRIEVNTLAPASSDAALASEPLDASADQMLDKF